MMADPNGERLYRAEAFLQRAPYLERFDDWTRAGIWIDAVVSSAWWRRLFPANRVQVSRVYLIPNAHDKRHWMTGGIEVDGRKRVGEISYPRRVRRPRKDGLSHELIHVALGHTAETPEEESHLADFCQLDLRFTRRFFGEDAERLLRERMVRYGVEFE
jgi:hypothetical protein